MIKNKFCTKFYFFALILLLSKSFAQDSRPLSTDILNEKIQLKYSASKNYILVERTDLRCYENKKYLGLLSRELRSVIYPEKTEDDFTFYSGDFYVWQETRRNNQKVQNGIHDSIESKFKISDDGIFEMIEDNGFPSFRNFPSYTKEKLKPGDTWTANAQRVVDPKNKNVFTELPMYVEYKYLRNDIYNDEDVFVLSAKWATRYGGKYIDENGDSSLKSANGSHNATIIVSQTNGRSLLVKDIVDEAFIYNSGEEISFKGTITLFTEYPPSYNSKEILENFTQIIKAEDELTNERSVSENLKNQNEQSLVKTEDLENFENKNLSVEKTNIGLRLTIKNLEFKPNTSELVFGEEKRLESICEILKTLENQMLLIEGHTARVGDESNEEKLSLKRAHTIANEMIKRGINAQNIICKGSGGKKPIADNSTEEGRKLNRRVEITILE